MGKQYNGRTGHINATRWQAHKSIGINFENTIPSFLSPSIIQAEGGRKRSLVKKGAWSEDLEVLPRKKRKVETQVEEARGNKRKHREAAMVEAEAEGGAEAEGEGEAAAASVGAVRGGVVGGGAGAAASAVVAGGAGPVREHRLIRSDTNSITPVAGRGEGAEAPEEHLLMRSGKGSTGFKGVVCPSTGRYRAKCTTSPCCHLTLGSFGTPEEAAQAYLQHWQTDHPEELEKERAPPLQVQEHILRP
jgi:hypothetical protein